MDQVCQQTKTNVAPAGGCPIPTGSRRELAIAAAVIGMMCILSFAIEKIGERMDVRPQPIATGVKSMC